MSKHSRRCRVGSIAPISGESTLASAREEEGLGLWNQFEALVVRPGYREPTNRGLFFERLMS
jgi:hypothetical protein